MLQAVLGIFVLYAIAFALSESHRDVRLRPIVVGVAMQFAIALLLLRAPGARSVLLLANDAVRAIEHATTAGTSFVFGYLGGAPPPEGADALSRVYIFGFRVLPQIVLFSVLVAVLWHWRVLQVVIRGFAWALHRTLGVGGAVGVATASTMFLGPVENSLLIRAYLRNMSRSEFFIVMTAGMATVAGSVMVIYANVLGPILDGALAHILVASTVNVFGTVGLARVMVPSDAATEGGADLADTLKYDSTMDAVTSGTTLGLRLAVNVGVMLIVLISLVALLNSVLSLVTIGDAALTLQRLLGWIFAPIAWLIGIPWSEAVTCGSLLGTKLVLNELVAYIQLAGEPNLSASTRLVMTYALCGFANFGSLGILLGGMGALIPERRVELFELAPKTLISGTLVTCTTGAVAAIVTSF